MTVALRPGATTTPKTPRPARCREVRTTSGNSVSGPPVIAVGPPVRPPGDSAGLPISNLSLSLIDAYFDAAGRHLRRDRNGREDRGHEHETDD